MKQLWTLAFGNRQQKQEKQQLAETAIPGKDGRDRKTQSSERLRQTSPTTSAGGKSSIFNEATQNEQSMDGMLAHLVSGVRSQFVRNEFMLIPEQHYTDDIDVNIQVCTYNVSGSKPLDYRSIHQILAPLLPASDYILSNPTTTQDKSNATPPSLCQSHLPTPDILVFGFQEIVALNAGNVLISSTADGPIAWDTAIHHALNGPATQFTDYSSDIEAFAEYVIDALDSGKIPAQLGLYKNSSNVSEVTFDANEQDWQQTMSQLESLKRSQTDEVVASTMGRKVSGLGARSDSFVQSDDMSSSSSSSDSEEEVGMIDSASLQQDNVLGGNESSGGIVQGTSSDPAATTDPQQQVQVQPEPSQRGEPDEYVQIASEQLVGVYLSVWCKTSVASHIKGLQVKSVRTGGFGFLGNKGAVVARMRVYDTPLAVVVSHLAAGDHPGDVNKRNYDVSEINRRARFSAGKQEPDGHENNITWKQEQAARKAAQKARRQARREQRQARRQERRRQYDASSPKSGNQSSTGVVNRQSEGEDSASNREKGAQDEDGGGCSQTEDQSVAEQRSREKAECRPSASETPFINVQQGSGSVEGLAAPSPAVAAAYAAFLNVKHRVPWKRAGHWAGVSRLTEHEHVVWLGDLNYRIKLPANVVRNMVATGNIEQLTQHDELSNARGQGDAFMGYHESMLSFNPTYKYYKGTSIYSGDMQQYNALVKKSSDSITQSAARSPSLDDLSASYQQANLSTSSSYTENMGGLAPTDNPLSQSKVSPASSPRKQGTSPTKKSPATQTPVTQPRIERIASQGDDDSSDSGDSTDSGSPRKVRVPSWTDRVLTWSSPEVAGRLRHVGYTSCESLVLSDHKPVTCSMQLTAKRYRKKKISLALDLARRTADAKEMAAVPRCTLTPQILDAGLVRYRSAVGFTCTLKNTGITPASYIFKAMQSLDKHVVEPPPTKLRVAGVSYPRHKSIDWTASAPTGTVDAFPDWLYVQPKSGLLEAGEACEIQLVVYLHGGNAGVMENILVGGGCKLDAILVLSVAGGSDHFVSVVGQAEGSVIGQDIDLLSGVDHVVGPQSKEVAQGPVAPSDTQQNIGHSEQSQLGAEHSKDQVVPLLEDSSSEQCAGQDQDDVANTQSGKTEGGSGGPSYYEISEDAIRQFLDGEFKFEESFAAQVRRYCELDDQYNTASFQDSFSHVVLEKNTLTHDGNTKTGRIQELPSAGAFLSSESQQEESNLAQGATGAQREPSMEVQDGADVDATVQVQHTSADHPLVRVVLTASPDGAIDSQVNVSVRVTQAGVRDSISQNESVNASQAKQQDTSTSTQQPSGTNSRLQQQPSEEAQKILGHISSMESHDIIPQIQQTKEPGSDGPLRPPNLHRVDSGVAQKTARARDVVMTAVESQSLHLEQCALYAQSQHVGSSSHRTMYRVDDSVVPRVFRGILQRLQHFAEHGSEVLNFSRAYAYVPEHVLHSTPIGSMHDQRQLEAVDATVMKQVQLALNNQQLDDSDGDIHHTLAALLVLLRELPQPLLPSALHKVCQVCLPGPQSLIGLLATSLTPPKFNTLLSIINVVKVLTTNNRYTNAMVAVQVQHIARGLSEVMFSAGTVYLQDLHGGMSDLSLRLKSDDIAAELQSRYKAISMLIVQLP